MIYMLEMFPFIMVFVAFIFFYMSTKLKGEWQNLEFLFLFLGFIFLIISAFMIGLVATGSTAVIGMQVMWILILVLIVVFLFFILFLIKNTLEATLKR